MKTDKTLGDLVSSIKEIKLKTLLFYAKGFWRLSMFVTFSVCFVVLGIILFDRGFSISSDIFWLYLVCGVVSFLEFKFSVVTRFIFSFFQE